MRVPVRCYSPVGRSKGYLKFIDLFPFSFRPISLRNSEKLLQALMRRVGW